MKDIFKKLSKISRAVKRGKGGYLGSFEISRAGIYPK